jgi:hypothetical protein
MVKKSLLKYFVLVCAVIAVQSTFASLPNRQEATKNEARRTRGHRNFFQRNKVVLISLAAAIVAAGTIGCICWHKKQRPIVPQEQGPIVPQEQRPIASQEQRPIASQEQRPIASQEQRPIASLADQIAEVANVTSNDFLDNCGGYCSRDSGSAGVNGVDGVMVWRDGVQVFQLGDSKALGLWSRRISRSGLKAAINTAVDHFASDLNRSSTPGRLLSPDHIDAIMDPLCQALGIDPSITQPLRDGLGRVPYNNAVLGIKSFVWNYLIGGWFLYESTREDQAWTALYDMYQSFPSGGHPTSFSRDIFKSTLNGIMIQDDAYHNGFLQALVWGMLPNDAMMPVDESVIIP